MSLTRAKVERGSRFGCWTVIDAATATRKNGYLIACECRCGTRRGVVKKYLLNGKSKSCGCRGYSPGARVGAFLIVSRRRRGGYWSKDVVYSCEHGVRFKSRISAGGLPRVKTCPCNRSHKTTLVHGESSTDGVRTTEYNIWRIMRQRCNNKNNPAFRYYGGRGVFVCGQWDDYRVFLSDMGRRPSKKHSLDRINPFGNYTPENCRWATILEQRRNRRDSKKWAEHLFKARMSRGKK